MIWIFHQACVEIIEYFTGRKVTLIIGDKEVTEVGSIGVVPREGEIFKSGKTVDS